VRKGAASSASAPLRVAEIEERLAGVPMYALTNTAQEFVLVSAAREGEGRGREAAASARAALLPEGGCRHAAGADGGPAGFHRRAARGRGAVAATACLLGGVARLPLLAIPTWLPPLPPRAPTATRGGPPACRSERPAGDSRKKWRG
jgi:hypothetical protein